MSIASEITRLAGLRDTIRSKLLDFGIITDSSANLSACSDAINDISESALSIPSIAITPGMSINSSTGIVTASGSGSGTVSASKGYSKGTSGAVNASASNTLQLATQAAQTITPGTSNKTIAAGRWLTGAQTIKGDSNLIAANIKSGKSIFGVTGTMANYQIKRVNSLSGSQAVPLLRPGSTTYYCRNLPIDISGINPKYVFAYGTRTDYTPCYHTNTFAVLTGTYVNYGYIQYGSSTYFLDLAGTNLSMQGNNLMIPVGRSSTSSTYGGGNVVSANTFNIVLLGE